MTQHIPETPRPVFSAGRIAEVLAPEGEAPRLPTPEQARIIEHPLGGSALVIAGAGSGKTETMANRVVWLIANGLTEPSQVLGLTFTRKAAGELNERIAARLLGFAERLEDLRSLGRLTTEETEAADRLSQVLADGLDLPDVSTYNAFASSIVQEFGALAGVAAAATVVDAPTAWGIARDVVCRSSDPDLRTTEFSIGKLVKLTMELDHAVSDNLTTFDGIERSIQEYEAAESWSFARNRQKKPYALVQSTVAAVRATRLIVRLAEAFAAEKRRRGLIEFSDQLALAVLTLTTSPEAVMSLRRRTSVVLLDEVQDTSVGQTRLLAQLFAGTSVMAVGDPHQSIYGFRGASASNLLTFHEDFAGARGAPRGVTLNLSVSWRNPTEILRVANTISRPLSEKLEREAGASALSVKPLQSRQDYLSGQIGAPEQVDADTGATAETVIAPAIPRTIETPATEPRRVEWRFAETIDDEFESLAAWMASARDEHAQRTGALATAAVVCRKRARMPAIQAALHRAGVPARIVGLGGLLSTPEITDLVSVLRCTWYADAGSELLRILTGPRFRIGPADIAGLREAARWFASHDVEMRPLDAVDVGRSGVLADPDREVTLIDALDEIAGMSRLDRPSLRSISAVGRKRFRDAGLMLRRLRRHVGGNIVELLRLAEYELRIDIELDAHELSGHSGSAAARANLDAFSELIEGFLATDDRGSLVSVLEWLERATEIDDVAEHVPEPEPGTVQLITAHGSKGLEWDLVAVPRLVEAEFPAPPREGKGWLHTGRLPDQLRGDRAARPSLDWRSLAAEADQKSLIDAIEVYHGELQARHADEERRLAYVAVTRSASRLLLTGSFWSSAKAPRPPSPYLWELSAAGVLTGLPDASALTENPTSGGGRTMLWPGDPLGARAATVQAAAAVVREARGESAQAPDQHPREAKLGIDPVVELLLAEHRTARRPELASSRPDEPDGSDGSDVVDAGIADHAELPQRITASTFHEFVQDPDEAERRRIRPLPVRPYRRTRIGNQFHEWVERRSTTARGTAIALPGFESEDFAREEPEPEVSGRDEVSESHDAGADLQQLIAHFESSRWATLQPVAVELEVTLPFAGRSLVCKLDAVYEFGDGDDRRYEVVDWKSGRPPKNDAERDSRFLQLDLYRHAYAQWADIDPARIDVSLFYVADGVELKGVGNRSFADLEQLWLSAAHARSAS